MTDRQPPREEGLFAALWSLLRWPVPPDAGGYLAFGWLLLLLLLIQGATGVLLSVYYQPSPEGAAAAVELVMRDVDGGWLVRGIHHWNANLIVGLSFVQLLRVLADGSYRGARRASWFIGCLLLFVVLGEAASGVLLPWDDRAYWTAVRVSAAIEGVPVVGGPLALLLRGGEQVTGFTLSRLHTAHTLVLPWFTVVLLVTHLWLMSRRRHRP